MSDEPDDNAAKWHAVAAVYGYNELAKMVDTLGEKVYFRLLRGQFEEEAERRGCKLTFSHAGPIVLEMSQEPPFIIFHERDIELMRAAVAKFDDEHTPAAAPRDASLKENPMNNRVDRACPHYCVKCIPRKCWKMDRPPEQYCRICGGEFVAAAPPISSAPYWTERPGGWALRMPCGHDGASVWMNGVWHTWDRNGVGGENAEAAATAQAKNEALAAVLRQGWHGNECSATAAPRDASPKESPMNNRVDRACPHYCVKCIPRKCWKMDRPPEQYCRICGGEFVATPRDAEARLEITEARGWAARIWCEPEHSAMVMDARLAESIAHQLVYAFNRGHRYREAEVEALRGQVAAMRTALERIAKPNTLRTYDARKEAHAIAGCRHGLGPDGRNHSHSPDCNMTMRALERAYNAGREAGLSRAEGVAREYLGHLDREDISPLIRIAVRETANRITSARERTPALCAETEPATDCGLPYVNAHGLAMTCLREPGHAPVPHACQGRAAEPTPREPKAGEVWRESRPGGIDWLFTGVLAWPGGPWMCWTLDGKWDGNFRTSAFTDGTLTFVRRAASGTPGDVK